MVLYVQYGKSGYSPVAKTKGSGEAWVFTAGKLFQGTWARDDAAQPFTLKDTAGNIIKLTPGNTWVELPRLAKGVSFLPGTDPTTLTDCAFKPRARSSANPLKSFPGSGDCTVSFACPCTGWP